MDTLTIVLWLLIGLVTCFYLLCKKRFEYWKNRGIPYLEPLTIPLGNLSFSKYVEFKDINQKFYDKKNGNPFLGGFFFMKPILMATDLDFVQNVLVKDFSSFHERGLYVNEADDPLSAHMFAVDGEKWKSLRAKLSPTFTSGRMKLMFPTVVEVAARFNEVLTEMVSPSTTLEMKELLSRFTTDVIGTCAFGIECNSLRTPNSDFRTYGSKVFDDPLLPPLAQLLCLEFPNLARKLHIRFLQKDVINFFLNLVRETIAMREDKQIRRNDFMDLLIQLKNGNSLDEHSKALGQMTLEEIAAQAFLFFLAGFETSSTTMMFALYELAINPHIQDKVRKEINDVLAKHDGKLTYESVKEMVYIDRTISDSPHRLNQKRTTTAAEKTSIGSKPSGPPAKMAHVVGVPKRDPCSACGLPVFLAERLTIPGAGGSGTKRIYHRTCLRCARCKSQLTPGSFYETEVDGEYCCETCPDEEIIEAISPATKLDLAGRNEPMSSASGSIAGRLAFFENDGKKLLQKSLSDEEKSQSLQKMSESQQSAYKRNPALSKFMSSHLADTTDSGAESVSRDQSNDSSRRSSTSSSSASAMVEEKEAAGVVAPDLPKSLPPSLTPTPSEKNAPTLKEAKNTTSTFTSSLQLSLNTADGTQLETPTPSTSLHSPTATPKQKASDKLIKPENDKQLELDKPKRGEIESPTKSIGEHSTPTKTLITDVSSTEKTNVTKDISDTDEKMRTIATGTLKDSPITTPSSPTSSSKTKAIPSPQSSPTKFDDISETNRSSMVRARLHQFEIISSNNNSPSSSISSNINNLSNKDLSGNDRNAVEEQMSIDIDLKNVDENAKTTTETKTVAALENEVPKIVTMNTIVTNTNVASDTDDSVKSSSKSLENNNNEDKQQSVDASCPKEQIHYSEEKVETEKVPESTLITSTPLRKTSDANLTEDYPEELNPFKSDDENDDENMGQTDEKNDAKSKEEQEKIEKEEKRKSLNPFDSSDDEVECQDDSTKKVKPPRPPPPKLKSMNPFDSEDDDAEDDQSVKTLEITKKRPVPTPRSLATSSQNTTPEPTPRLSRQTYTTPLSNTSEQFGSSTSLTQSAGLNLSTDFLRRGSDTRGSSHSISSSTGSLSGTKYKKGKKAPLPPKQENGTVKELFPAPSLDVQKVSPQPRKKRPAPAPPPVGETKPASSSQPDIIISNSDDVPSISLPYQADSSLVSNADQPSLLPHTDDVKSDEEKLRDEANLEQTPNQAELPTEENELRRTRRLISVDKSILGEFTKTDHPDHEESVVYRRTIAPLVIDNSMDDEEMPSELHDRQLEKLKDNKEAKNRNRQSQVSLPTEENDPLFNKSVQGKWKRRKGPAPALPVPPKKVLQMVPLQDIRHELEIIEVQQQGLEKQGVMLEKMIRERCEGGDTSTADESKEEETSKGSTANSKEVEDLIMQLFELVNEKNELFRRQAELMYLRRQHRLEQEQADLEYEIRVLMAQPERNKTDSDKAREEALIARLVEVVQLRNEVVECLEMDRLREAEEDMSIKQRLEMHAAKRDEELCKQTPTKLSKKEKKRQKEIKKLGKSKKMDADKDADESELPVTVKKEKKKKKNLLSGVIAFK